MGIINAAKKRQEAEANKNASILLEELDYEKKKEEKRKAAAQKKRDKKKQKKKKKSFEKQYNGITDNDDEEERDDEDEEDDIPLDRVGFPFVATMERNSMVIDGEEFSLVFIYLNI